MYLINYNSINYADFLNAFSQATNISIYNGAMRLPASFGSGYMWVMNLSNDISLMISDTTFKHDVILNRQPSLQPNYYSLQFSEAYDDTNAKLITNEQEVEKARQHSVWLSNTKLANRYNIPPGLRIRSVKILFHKNHLLQLLDKETTESFLSNYFSLTLQQPFIKPIDADYRQYMELLIKEKIDQPLRNAFIENRVMLLLETFLVKTNQLLQSQKKIKLSESEIVRLMQVEALLIKDYKQPPPTITALSKICAMSATKLKMDFKLLYGAPIYVYYQRNKMIKAKAILLEGRNTIKEVGKMVGYSNLSHFAAAFKKEFGATPSEMLKGDEVIDMLGKL
jgi:AraC-like DNA-binding protein